MRKKTLKKLAWKMLIEQIIDFESRGLYLVAVNVLLQLFNFMTKQKSLKENLRVD